MGPTTFQTPLRITHVGTATAVIKLEGLTILTDPYFSPAGTKWQAAAVPGVVLSSSYQPALSPQDLPPIDLVLLSHEDHEDNLDDLGRLLLDGRHTLTTPDGSRKLQPRPGVRGLQPWETIKMALGGHEYAITATPCVHLPSGECTGFVISAPHFGITGRKPNVIYFSGDTIYLEELGGIAEQYHVSVALLNLGKATVPGSTPITMDGEQGAKLAKSLAAEVVIPMHYDGWAHFAEGRQGAEAAFEKAALAEKVLWLVPGVETQIF